MHHVLLFLLEHSMLMRSIQPYLRIRCRGSSPLPPQTCLPYMHTNPTSTSTSSTLPSRSCLSIRIGGVDFSHTSTSGAKGLAPSRCAAACHACIDAHRSTTQKTLEMKGTSRENKANVPLFRPPTLRVKGKSRENRPNVPSSPPRGPTTQIPLAPPGATRRGNHRSHNPETKAAMPQKSPDKPSQKSQEPWPLATANGNRS